MFCITVGLFVKSSWHIHVEQAFGLVLGIPLLDASLLSLLCLMFNSGHSWSCIWDCWSIVFGDIPGEMYNVVWGIGSASDVEVSQNPWP